MIIRTITPPPGSAIAVTADAPAPVIAIPQPSGGGSRYLIGLFILFWLGMWFVGWRGAWGQITASAETPGGVQPFLVFWLAAWTVGGAYAGFMIFRIFRPSVAETFTLGSDGVAYDSGIPPFQQSWFNRYGNQFWKAAFVKRTRVTLSRQDLRTLRLRETDSGNRLTADVASRRVELATAASEVEREWLYRVLSERYGLTS